MGLFIAVSTPILFLFIAGVAIMLHHGYTHQGNFFDISDMKLAFASHESILFLIVVLVVGVILGGLLF